MKAPPKSVWAVLVHHRNQRVDAATFRDAKVFATERERDAWIAKVQRSYPETARTETFEYRMAHAEVDA